MAGKRPASGQKSKQSISFRSNQDVAVHVTDLAKAEEFYGDVLGFKLVTRGEDHLAFDTGTFRLWVNKDRKPQSYVPSFSVPNFADARRHLEAHGCRPATAKSTTYFMDPFGFVFDIIERD